MMQDILKNCKQWEMKLSIIRLMVLLFFNALWKTNRLFCPGGKRKQQKTHCILIIRWDCFVYFSYFMCNSFSLLLLSLLGRPKTNLIMADTKYESPWYISLLCWVSVVSSILFFTVVHVIPETPIRQSFLSQKAI